MTDDELLESLYREADRIRSDGSLPPGYELQIRESFAQIAANPGELEAEVALGSAQADAAGSPGAAGSLAQRGLGKAARLSRRVARAGRRRLGPRLRSLQRQGVERAGAAGGLASMEVQIVTDRARRAVAGSRAARGLARAASGSRGPAASPRALRTGVDGRVGDEEIDRVLSERLEDVPGGRILHAESGDGVLVERLRGMGFDASGADARHGTGASRRGALEALAQVPKGSLGAIVLSGVTDRVTPASARALTRLVSTRLAEGGTVVVLSAHPGPLVESDPVAADLSAGRSLHPVTWCHLFARFGLEEMSVRETRDGSAYAVVARRRRP